MDSEQLNISERYKKYWLDSGDNPGAPFLLHIPKTTIQWKKKNLTYGVFVLHIRQLSLLHLSRNVYLRLAQAFLCSLWKFPATWDRTLQYRRQSQGLDIHWHDQIKTATASFKTFSPRKSLFCIYFFLDSKRQSCHYSSCHQIWRVASVIWLTRLSSHAFTVLACDVGQHFEASSSNSHQIAF